jgi:hypothetical protein
MEVTNSVLLAVTIKNKNRSPESRIFSKSVFSGALRLSTVFLTDTSNTHKRRSAPARIKQKYMGVSCSMFLSRGSRLFLSNEPVRSVL